GPGTGPTAGSRGGAEERVHDVLEADERAAGAARAEPGPLRGVRVPTQVDDLPLLRIREDLVGGVDLLELLRRLRVRVDVRVVLAGQPAVGALDLLIRRVLRHAENSVVVPGHCPVCPHPSVVTSVWCSPSCGLVQVSSAPADPPRSVPRPAP